MSIAQPVPIRFGVGARTLARIERRLVRVALNLDAVLAGTQPVLPPLDEDADGCPDGWIVTSLPETGEAMLRFVHADALVYVRQRYVRHHADLTIGFDAWWAGLSGNARSGLKRKAKRIAARSGGTVRIGRFATPDELVRFHAIARPLAKRTYQERLLGAALPGDEAFRRSMLATAAAGDVRAWTLEIDGAPAAYLYGEREGSALTYRYVGHDPAHAELSPGSVLHVEAFRDLFAEASFARFDFTEGDGQHKKTFATGGTRCVDLLILRPTIANRAVVAGLAAFDRALSVAKRAAGHPVVAPVARIVRRG